MDDSVSNDEILILRYIPMFFDKFISQNYVLQWSRNCDADSWSHVRVLV